ncbi:MAG: hypothetical protein OIF54_10955, partial [Cohaesibacter sp.]|nr:hypothetical protein [Cohaesibacter sp.]
TAAAILFASWDSPPEPAGGIGSSVSSVGADSFEVWIAGAAEVFASVFVAVFVALHCELDWKGGCLAGYFL